MSCNRITVTEKFVCISNYSNNFFSLTTSSIHFLTVANILFVVLAAQKIVL